MMDIIECVGIGMIQTYLYITRLVYHTVWSDSGYINRTVTTLAAYTTRYAHAKALVRALEGKERERDDNIVIKQLIKIW